MALTIDTSTTGGGQTFSGTVTGSNAYTTLNKIGSGTQTVGGTFAWAGPVVVSGGTLTANGDIRRLGRLTHGRLRRHVQRQRLDRPARDADRRHAGRSGYV